MSSVRDSRDSAISITSEGRHENVDTQVDDIIVSGVEKSAKKSTSSSIQSNTADHVVVAKKTTLVDSNHSINNSIARSTTVLDVDGTDRNVKEIANKTPQTYKKLRDNICLGITIAIVCGIVLTPIILFYTRPNISNPFENNLMQPSCQDVSSRHITRFTENEIK